MAEFNMDGLLGTMFGSADSELEKLLTAKQKEQLGLQHCSRLVAAAHSVLVLAKLLALPCKLAKVLMRKAQQALSIK